ncbi:uncharacterized protein VTP21DRAFT_5846 [Calcarisporiella thermophila]|uniref:uncharacterized protein n=1 Tax=Calcarisporiella thermophila TaxID=911321 RepID=UPI0037431DCA
MQSTLLVRNNPRSLCLRPVQISGDTPASVLVFEQYHGSVDPKCVVRLVPVDEFDVSNYTYLNAHPVYGCLGLIHVNNEIFLSVITDCIHLGKIRPGESVHRITDVAFYSLSNGLWDDVDSYNARSYDEDDDGTPVAHPCNSLKKLFANGSYYFSSDFDLTRTVQARITSGVFDLHAFDDHFLWNWYLLKELLKFRENLSGDEKIQLDRGGFLVLAIQGYVGISDTYIDGHRAQLSILSKLSCKRAGTRFNTRGIDDDGNVANFVETETILQTDQWCLAYTQIRGSVPVFWEQQGIQVMNHRIKISRGADATRPASEKHFAEQLSRYGRVHAINLLQQREGSGELTLSQAYEAQTRLLRAQGMDVSLTNFDFHSECRGGNYENVSSLIRRLNHLVSEFGYFLVEGERDAVVLEQSGVFRTSCLDSLDRTNIVQSELSRQVILHHLRSLGLSSEGLLQHHSMLWAENGDGLSRIYAGTGALKTTFTRTGKVSFATLLNDATKSVNRFVINNFQDKSKQESIDYFLGKLMSQKEIMIHDPIHEAVAKDLLTRAAEYTSTKKITIFTGTYNLNGKLLGTETLDPWLWGLDSAQDPELFAIAFQEIVELTPQQIVSADVEKLVYWEKQTERILNSSPKRSSPRHRYIMIRTGQLVGAALLIFAREDIVPFIKNVECSMKKTGLRGMSGNKGAVAIRLDFADTSLCFVTGHFAAGHSNYDERNNDYRTISEGLAFKRGRGIADHDAVIWAGDFNYRIGLSNEDVRYYVQQGNLLELLKNDQLLQQMQLGQVFQGFEEGTITFDPTYKYDNGTHHYDTSEKQRIPSWTDRILYRGKPLRQLGYSRAELLVSDHRPVMSLFEVDILVIDHAAKGSLMNHLYKEKVKEAAGKVAALSGIPPQEKKAVESSLMDTGPPTGVLVDLSVDEAEEVESLPLPSSQSFRWWEVGRDAHPPKGESRATTSKKNPFLDDESEEEGWIEVKQWEGVRPAPLAQKQRKKKNPFLDEDEEVVWKAEIASEFQNSDRNMAQANSATTLGGEWWAVEKQQSSGARATVRPLVELHESPEKQESTQAPNPWKVSSGKSLLDDDSPMGVIDQERGGGVEDKREEAGVVEERGTKDVFAFWASKA